MVMPKPTDTEFAAAAQTVSRYIADMQSGWDRTRTERLRRQLKDWSLELEDVAYTAGTAMEARHG